MADSLRIAFFLPSFLPKCSGAEIFHHNLAVRLAARGHEISIVLPRRYASALAEVPNLPYSLIAYPANLWSWFKRSPAVAQLLNRRELSRLQLRHGFDLWHGVVLYPTGICLVDWQQRTRDCPYLVRSVGDDILSSPESAVGMRTERRLAELIRKTIPHGRMIVALSETMRREYLALGVPAERVTVIPNAVDLARFEKGEDRTQTRRRLAIDRFAFLAVGRNHPQKDYPTLLDAAAALRQAGSEPFQLLIAGRDIRALQPEVDRRGLQGVVRLFEMGLLNFATAGPTAFALPPPAMIDLYRAADVFVMTSILEGFSSALLEAMAAGLPVVVADSPGSADFVREENSGWIVPPRDPAALASRLRELMQNAGARADLSSRSRSRASQFDWPAVVDRYLALYRQLIAAQKAAGGPPEEG